jgi:hypothetical protein
MESIVVEHPLTQGGFCPLATTFCECGRNYVLLGTHLELYLGLITSHDGDPRSAHHLCVDLVMGNHTCNMVCTSHLPY